MADIEQELLATLIARESIEGVIHEYAAAIDAHDADRLAACFVSDARYVVKGTSVTDGVENIVASIAPFFESSYVNSTHFMGRPSIRLRDDEADVETAAVVYLAEQPKAGGVVKLRGITYTDRFVCRNGRWLIAQRQHDARWMTESESEDLATFSGSKGISPDAAARTG